MQRSAGTYVHVYILSRFHQYGNSLPAQKPLCPLLFVRIFTIFHPEVLLMLSAPLSTIAILILTALLLTLFSLHYDPQKPHARYLRHGVVGLLMLCLWNCLPLPKLGVNPLSVMITGSLGWPGLGLVAVMNLLP